ncbi:uncharacterized protein LOC100177226 [Ciona intestinalis]
METVGNNMDTVGNNSINPEANSLAEDQVAYITKLRHDDVERMRTEVGGWISEVLGKEVTSQNILSELRSGVTLLYVARSLELLRHQEDNRYDKDIEAELRHLTPDDVLFGHNPAQMVARQRTNISKFLDWCRDIGVKTITLFESEDLASEKNERQVLTCILNIAKIAARFGVTPPESVREEIKQEESRRMRKRDGGLLPKSGGPKVRYHVVMTSAMRDIIDLQFSLNFQEPTTATTRIMGTSFTKVFAKIKGDRHEATIDVTNFDSTQLHEEVVVIESIPEATEVFETRSEIITHEVGDMVIIDTLELTQNDNVIEHDVINPDKEDFATKSSTDTSNNNTTSENEYFTTHDVTHDVTQRSDDVGSLLYHTAYMDDVHDDVNDDDVTPGSKSAPVWTGYMDDVTEEHRESPDMKPNVFHETPIKTTTNKIFDEDEIMINYPPLRSLLSSTPSSHSSHSSNFSHSSHLSQSSPAPTTPPIPPRIFITPLASRRSSSSRSRRSSLSGARKLSNTSSIHDVTTITSLGLVQVVDEKKIFTGEEDRHTGEEPAVLEVRSENVQVRRSSIESIDSRATPNGSSPIILDPKLLRERSPDTDIEIGVFTEPVKRQSSFKQIVSVADEYMMPILVTSALILIGIGGVVAMVLLFPLT